MSTQVAKPLGGHGRLSATAAAEPLSAGAKAVFMAAVGALVVVHAAMGYGLYLAVGLLL